MAAKVSATSTSAGPTVRVRLVRPQRAGPRRRPGRGRTSGRRPRRAHRPAHPATAAHHGGDRCPAEAERTAGRPPRRGGPARKVGGHRSSRPAASPGIGRAAQVFSEVRVVPATRSASSLQPRMAAMVYLRSVKSLGLVRADPPGRTEGCDGRCAEREAWRPDVIPGRLVVLRRHRPENLRAFMRWYADPEVARLTRYQQAPLSPEEVQRFFYARIMGPTSSPWRSTSARRTA